MPKISKQTPVSRRYFKDTVSVRTFISDLVWRYENGKLSDAKFRNLISATNTLIKLHSQLFLEKDLRSLQDRLEEFEESLGELD